MQLTADLTRQLEQDFVSQSKNLLAQTAAMKNGIESASETQTAKILNTPIFSVDLTTGPVTNQKSSGRCWMFAALNTFRHRLIQSHQLEDFELSQNYTFFWDKYEKANWFHQMILETANQDLDSRKVAFLLQTPQQDGGQWDMIVSIFQKYGVVPKTVMPESEASSNSRQLNRYLNQKLRKDAMVLRQLVADKASEAEIIRIRKKLMREVYHILAISLGTPPSQFDFEYRDKNKEYHILRDMTPQSFYQNFVGLDLDNYIPIINAPTVDKPFNQTYTVELLGNVVGGKQVKYLNLPMAEFKALAVKQLEEGESIWFGCDVGQCSNRESGIMALDVYAIQDLFDVDLETSKAQRLDYGESLMTHAMVLTGVDLVDGKPTKWKVENSWGDQVGNKGYFVMSDDWMDAYTYQIVMRKDLLSESQLADFNIAPKVLAPWDPMGALA